MELTLFFNKNNKLMEDVKVSVSVFNQSRFACNTERFCINDGTVIKWI